MDEIPPPSPPPPAPSPPPLPANPPPPAMPPLRAAPAPRRTGTAWKIIALVLLCLLLVSLYSNLKHLFGGVSGHSSLPSRAGLPRLQETVLEDNDSTNKLAVIEVEGIISTQFERGGYNMVE